MLLSVHNVTVVWFCLFHFFQCEMAVGMKAFFESIASGPTKYMIFGGACESVTAPIAQAVHFWNIVQVSITKSHLILQVKNLYRNFVVNSCLSYLTGNHRGGATLSVRY